MPQEPYPVAIVAAEAPPRTRPSFYPEPFASQVAGRQKHPLGDHGHRLINETGEAVVYLEIGDRTPGDEGSYPDDDLKASVVDGKWKFVHKDGSPY